MDGFADIIYLTDLFSVGEINEFGVFCHLMEGPHKGTKSASINIQYATLLANAFKREFPIWEHIWEKVPIGN